ncbi:hypothetical protein B0O99DRAFT_663603 [Bisporella sp. PMI_857]|nr:hypothetical protein B0O99DRAFT_663603 [Bisporella sp. PMI_857]
MGFPAAPLRDKILDASSKVVITTNKARQGGKTIPTKAIVNEALLQCPHVKYFLVLKYIASDVPWCPSRDFWWNEEARKWPGYYPAESTFAGNPLFILYASGLTGEPKGLMHTTAGFLLGAITMTKSVFDMRKTDIYFCAGDVGWITCHTYLVYGPLLDIIDEYHITHFYAAPTALRILKNLRALGSIGEPFAPEVWKWYYGITETGCCVISPLTVPFFGIKPIILDPISGAELHGEAECMVHISGRRLSKAEAEAALLASPLVTEAAAVGANDDLTGQSLVAYITLKDATLVMCTIGAFAILKKIRLVSDLPKARLGKTMRRI